MMGHPMETNNGVIFEWFLKRIGNYVQDLTISLHQDEMVLGRGKNKGVRYSLGISRRHALFKKTADDQWEVKDLGSTNGVFINAVKISVDHFERIKEFDVIGLGVAEAKNDEYFSFILCRRCRCQHSDEDSAELPSEVPNLPNICGFSSEEIKDQETETIKRNWKMPKKILNQEKRQKQEAQIISYTFSNEEYKPNSLKAAALVKQENPTPINNEHSLQSSEKNTDFQTEKKFNINLENYNKHQNSTSFLYVSQKAKPDNVNGNFKFQESKRKRRNTVIAISSDDTDNSDGDDDVIHTPLKNYKLRKKRKLTIYYEECDLGNNKVSQKIVKTESENLNSAVECNYQTQRDNFPGRITKNCSHEDGVNGKPKLKQEFLGVDKSLSSLSATNSPVNSNRNLPPHESMTFQANGDNSIKMHNSEIPLCLKNDDVIEISDDEDPTVIKEKQNEFPNDSKKSANTPDTSGDGNAARISTLQSECKSEESIVRGKDNSSAIDNFLCSDDEMPTCEDGFDFKNKMDLGTNDKQSSRLVWPSEPGDCNKENEFFPELSETSDIEDEDVLPSEDKKHENTKSIKNESFPARLKPFEKRPHTGRIQLIEALPMNYRPSSVRGQGEWFTEKNAFRKDSVSGNATNKPEAEAKLKTPKTKSYGNSLYEKQSSHFRHTVLGNNKNEYSLKEKMRKSMGYRIRCPGGGSAVKKEDAPNILKDDSSITALKSGLGSSEDKVIEEAVTMTSLTANDPHASNDSKQGHKPRAVQRFPSRSERLIQSMMADDISLCKKKLMAVSRQSIVRST